LELARKIAAGDEASVEVFCQKYRQRLEYFCVKRGIPFEDGRDLAQETLANAVQQMRLGRFRGEASPEFWLTRILLNRVADYWRAKGREGIRVPLQDCVDAEERGGVVCTSAPYQDPDLTLAIEETLRAIPDEHRVILLLNALEGYTTREIAKLLGRSEGRVGALLAEAKHMFRSITWNTEENLIRRRLKIRG
jgi:RNA polymerase sigma-70 factor (ECF subfamily)